MSTLFSAKSTPSRGRLTQRQSERAERIAEQLRNQRHGHKEDASRGSAFYHTFLGPISTGRAGSAGVKKKVVFKKTATTKKKAAPKKRAAPKKKAALKK